MTGADFTGADFTGADFTGADFTGAGFTGADFAEVDIDLLADYVGGALDGTPDQIRVAALIAEEPAWRDAHTLLTGGMAQVGAGLHHWGAESEPMPADVFARLESALTSPVEQPEVAAAAEPHLVSVRKLDLDRARARRPRRSRARWGASLAAAAAAVGIAGVGIAYLGSGPSSNDSATSSAAGVAGGPGVVALPAGDAITSTNRDYTAASLQGSEVTPFSTGNAPLAAPSLPAPSPDRGESSGKSLSSGEGLVGGLSRLRPPAALQACLDAIGTANGAGVITVQTVDYARFAGRAALVVHFTAANGTWAWVSGPSCGLPGVGPATAYSVQVG